MCWAACKKSFGAWLCKVLTRDEASNGSGSKGPSAPATAEGPIGTCTCTCAAARTGEVLDSESLASAEGPSASCVISSEDDTDCDECETSDEAEPDADEPDKDAEAEEEVEGDVRDDAFIGVAVSAAAPICCGCGISCGAEIVTGCTTCKCTPLLPLKVLAKAGAGWVR